MGIANKLREIYNQNKREIEYKEDKCDSDLIQHEFDSILEECSEYAKHGFCDYYREYSHDNKISKSLGNLASLLEAEGFKVVIEAHGVTYEEAYDYNYYAYSESKAKKILYYDYTMNITW